MEIRVLLAWKRIVFKCGNGKLNANLKCFLGLWKHGMAMRLTLGAWLAAGAQCLLLWMGYVQAQSFKVEPALHFGAFALLCTSDYHATPH